MFNKVTKISGIVSAILLLFGLIKFYTDGFLNGTTNIILSTSVFLLIVYLIFNFKEIKNIFSKRVAQYIGNALVASLLVVGIVVMLNYVFNKHSIRLDLTENKRFTLAEQTVKVLRNLESDMKITAFFQSVDQGFVQDIITEYQYYTDKIQFNFFDPDKNPEIANNYGITSYRTTVLESEGKSERIENLNEQTLTNALIKVTREGKKAIYFMSGHGEHDIESFEKKGFATLKDKIVELNYDVKTLNLAREKSVPDNCSVLIVNGPKTELFSVEMDSIDAYLNRGGKVFFLLDPYPEPGMIDFFEGWGITVGNDLVIDYSGVGQLFGYPASVPLVTDYNSSHPIMAEFDMNSFFELVRSVTPESDGLPDGVSVDWLARTTPQSWGEVNFRWDEQNPDESVAVQFDEGKDIQGPVTIAAIATKTIGTAPAPGMSAENAALVVFGDSDFATNGYAQTSNSILFLNTVNWLAEEEDLVAIPPKNPEDRRVSMTAKQAKFSFVLTVFLLPGLIFILGLSVFFRRRRL